MHLAAHHPDRVHGVALLSNVVNHVPHRGLRPLALIRTYSLLCRQPIIGPLLLQPFYRWYAIRFMKFSNRFTTQEYAWVMERLSSWRAEHNRALHAAVARNKTSVFMAWAENDPLIEGSLLAEVGRRLPAGPRLAFPTGGHMIIRTRTWDIAEGLTQWMDDVLHALRSPHSSAPSDDHGPRATP